MLVFEEEVVRIICVYGPQTGRTSVEKEHFYNELSSECDLHDLG